MIEQLALLSCVIWQDFTDAEILARMKVFLESVQRSTRAIDNLAVPLSKAIAKNCHTELARLIILPNDGSILFRVRQGELIDLTRSAVRKLARRLGLDREKLLAADPEEWIIAFDGEPGGEFGDLTPGRAAYKNSIARQAPKLPLTTLTIKPPAPVHPDGPEAPNLLWIGGKSARLQKKPFALLSHMWNRDKSQIVFVAQSIWKPNQEWSDQSLSSHITRVNNALLERGSPISLSVKDGFVFKLNPTKS